MNSAQQSNPADPLGLTTTAAPFLRAAVPGVVQPPLQRQNMSHVGRGWCGLGLQLLYWLVLPRVMDVRETPWMCWRHLVQRP